MYRVAKRLARSADGAEDLVSQTLLDAWKGWHTFNGQYPRSWLLRIMHHRFFTEYRKQASQPLSTSFDESSDVGEESWAEVDWKLVGPRILEEVDRLDDHFRHVIVLCDMEELTYEEAALALGTKVGTIRSRLFRARRQLRRRLGAFTEHHA